MGSTAASKVKRADPARIDRFLKGVARIGRDSAGGWSRLAFSREERAAHALFASEAEELGLAVSTDAIGNTYAESSGDLPPAVVGSHLDTVPNGGNFDGTAGIAAALEAARLILNEGGLERRLRLVVFAGEEGARFGAPCIGSRTATGAFTEATLQELRDSEGRSVWDCALDVGLEPDNLAEARWAAGSVTAFFELHIEQGRVLEERQKPLGIVDTIAGSTRLDLRFLGQSDHSGATPMRLRQDALAGASEFILEVERLAAQHPTMVATVGRLKIGAGHGSLTTVPGEVTLGLDVRDVDSERQRELTESLLDEAARIGARRDLRVSAELLSDQSPVVLHNGVQGILAAAAAAASLPFCVMASGAAHDAAHVAKVAPAGMLLVPSRRGISHSPDEWTDPRDVARGADVLAGALKIIHEQNPD